jgi:hypothetical protein
LRAAGNYGYCLVQEVIDVRLMRTKLSFLLIAATLLAAGLTSAAMAAEHQPGQPACYGACPTLTRFSLSSRVVVYGREPFEVFRVTVRPGVADVPEFPRGTVAVKFGPLTLCMIRLARAQGFCSPSSHALPPRGRPYQIYASYSGNAKFSASTSRPQFLKVVRPGDIAGQSPA